MREKSEIISKTDLSLSGQEITAAATSAGPEQPTSAATGTYTVAWISTPLTFAKNEGTETYTPGTVNIVVGPNGATGTSAMGVSGGLEIPEGVEVNIYRAANGLTVDGNENAPIADENCFLIFGGKATGDNGNQTSQPGITVNGKLNVISGAICGEGSVAGAEGNPAAATGISINGTVRVSADGELQGNNSADNSTSSGITINQGGSLQANGGSIYSLKSGTGTGLGRPISGTLSGLNANGSTIYTSTPLATAQQSGATLQKGVWMQMNSTTNGEGSVLGAVNGTTFGSGEVTFTSNGYVVPLRGTQSLTITDGVNMTLPANYTLNIGSSATTTSTPNTADGTLTINSGGTFTIPATANVNMYLNSVLQNNGTIDVM